MLRNVDESASLLQVKVSRYFSLKSVNASDNGLNVDVDNWWEVEEK